MQFQHNEDRRMLADMLERFIAEQYGFEVWKRLAESPEGYSPTMWRRFAELGAVGALFDEADGGLGGAGFDVAVVFEQLGRGLVLEPFLDTLIVGRALAHSAQAAQHGSHRTVLEALIDGSSSAALAHDEPGCQHDRSHVATRATRHGQGWQLNGAKTVVTHGEQAQWLLVSARSEGAEDDTQGISLFLLPRDTAGVQVRGWRKIDGGRAADLSLREVQADTAMQVGVPGQGHAVLEYALGYGLLALCAEAIGAMDAAKEHTLEYLRTRKQFGVPIGSFQALQHRMADVLLEVEQARSAVINAAAAIGSANRVPREKALSAAKYTIGRTGARLAETCIQLHGGMGMTWELPLAHYAKRLVMIDHQLGDEDHHLQRYMALGREAAAG